MGIFDFLRKKKTEPEIQRIGFDGVKESVSKKRQEIEEKQAEPKKQIEEILSELIRGLEEAMTVLEHIDLRNKKAMDREKLIVKQNLDNFIYYLEKLISSLKELKQGSFGALIDDINSIFSEFEKKSLISFQKSTYLIGEELGEVRDNISKFFRPFNRIVKENMYLIDKMKIISKVKGKLKEIESLEKNEHENNDIIADIEAKIRDLEGDIRKKKREIVSIKMSPDYIEQMNTKQKLEKTKTRLIIELQKLREMIDFKTLAKIYHSAQKQMAIIKEFRDNFKDSFEIYGSGRLLELTNIREINQEPIKERIDTIDKIKKNLDSIMIEKDPTERLENGISCIKGKIAELNSEKFRKEKIDKKFRENINQIKEQISNALKSLDIILE